MFGLHLYDGFLKVVPVDNQGRINHQGKEAFRIRVEEREASRRLPLCRSATCCPVPPY